MIGSAYQVGARIHTNSWGSSLNSYETGTYLCVVFIMHFLYSSLFLFNTNIDSLGMDAFSFTNQDMIVLVAAGNDGKGGTASGSLGTPATAKNIIAVGAGMSTDFNWDSIGGFVNSFAKSTTGIKSEENLVITSE